MEIMKMKCTSCGADIEIAKEGVSKCPYCGATFYAERKDDNVIVNTVINNYNSTPPVRKKSNAGLIVMLCILIPMIILGGIYFMVAGNLSQYAGETGSTAEKNRQIVYQDAPKSQLMQVICAHMFNKSFDKVTQEDYDRLTCLKIAPSVADPWEITYRLDDGPTETWTPEDTDLEKLGDTDPDDEISVSEFQCFHNLASLDLTGATFIISRNFEYGSEDDSTPQTLGNLTKLTMYGATAWQPLSFLADGFFADPKQIMELGCTIQTTDDIAILTKNFPNIEKLSFDIMTSDDHGLPDLSGLSGLTKLRDLSAPATQDMAYLATLSSLKDLSISGGGSSDETVSDYSVLYGMPELESLKLLDTGGLKDIGFVENMKSLTSFELTGSKVKSLDGISACKNLTSLTAKDNRELTDTSDIARVKSLIKLDCPAFGTGKNDFKSLTKLKELTILPEAVPHIGGLASLEKLTITGSNDFDNLCSLAVLGKLTRLKKLTMHGGDLGIYTTDDASLSKCTALKEITLEGIMLYDGNADFADYFNIPSLERLTLIEEECNITPDKVKDNTHLKSLSFSDGKSCIILSDGKGSYDYGNYQDLSVITDVFKHFQGMEELSVPDGNIENIDFAESMPELRKADFSHNYIKDVSPLAGLSKLQSVDLTDNPVRNADVIPETVTVIK